MFYKRDMKHFSRYAWNVLAPGGQRHKFCPTMHFSMFYSMFYYEKDSFDDDDHDDDDHDHDGGGYEEAEDTSDVTNAVKCLPKV